MLGKRVLGDYAFESEKMASSSSNRASRGQMTIAARSGLNVSADKRKRYFTPIPKAMRFKIPWLGSTHYPWTCSSTDGGLKPVTSYVFIDPLNYQGNIGPTDSSQPMALTVWYSPQLFSMLIYYAEGRYRTHSLKASISYDWKRKPAVDSSNDLIASGSMIPALQVAFAKVPLSYLRKSDGEPHVVDDAGTLFEDGYDYFTALQTDYSAKARLLSTNGNSNSIVTLNSDIDVYEHNGNPQVITTTRTWNADADHPSIQYSHPNPSTRQVYLLAFRTAYSLEPFDEATLLIRVAYQLDQHMEFSDPQPVRPYTGFLA